MTDQPYHVLAKCAITLGGNHALAEARTYKARRTNALLYAWQRRDGEPDRRYGCRSMLGWTTVAIGPDDLLGSPYFGPPLGDSFAAAVRRALMQVLPHMPTYVSPPEDQVR